METTNNGGPLVIWLPSCQTVLSRSYVTLLWPPPPPGVTSSGWLSNSTLLDIIQRVHGLLMVTRVMVTMEMVTMVTGGMSIRASLWSNSHNCDENWWKLMLAVTQFAVHSPSVSYFMCLPIGPCELHTTIQSCRTGPQATMAQQVFSPTHRLI